MKQITIALVEDHHLVRQSLIEILKSVPHFQVVFDTASGNSAIEHFKTLEKPPDVVLLDIELRDSINGFQTAEIISGTWPDVRIIALTSHVGEFAVQSMLRVGALGFLSKGSSFEDLKKAITAVYNGDYYYNKLVFGIKIRQSREDDANVIDFSSLEMEFLKLMVEGLNYDECAKKMHKSVRTIHNYRDQLLKKTNTQDKTELLIFAFANGLGNIAARAIA